MPSPPSNRSPHSSHHHHHHPRPPHTRERSKSETSRDPFRDPDYVAPRLDYDPPGSTRTPQPARRTHRQPDPQHDNMLAAVRDTVTVDKSHRSRVERSKTGDIPASRSGSRHTPRRSYSQDSGSPVTTAEKSRKPKKTNSSHADVIDRLDFTSVGPMFHHDGPFDACAPSRNRHKTKAPMFAWAGTAEDESAPSATQHRHRADRRLHSVSNMLGNQLMNTPDSELHKRKVDPIAEAWGMHEPEPYEEFFGGGGSGNVSTASSIRAGAENHNHWRPSQDSKEQEKPLPSVRKPRSVPPPQPLRLPGEENISPPLASPTSPGAPKRSKSLMQRIRNMRDAPNVPVDAIPASDDTSPQSSVENYNPASQVEVSPRQGRPAHRHQNSFFGRFGRATAGQVSPTSEQYVYIETNKALPARPQEEPAKAPNGGSPQMEEYDAPSGIGRRSSLLRKVKGVKGAVRGSA